MATKPPWLATVPRRVTSPTPSPLRPAARIPGTAAASAPRRKRLTNGSRRPSGLYEWPACGAGGAGAAGDAWAPGAAGAGVAAPWGAGVTAGVWPAATAAPTPNTARANQCARMCLSIASGLGRLGLGRLGGLGALGGGLFFGRHQHERRGRAVGADRRAGGLRLARPDGDVPHVDDSGELAHPFEERAQIVVGAVHGEGDGRLGVQVLERQRVRE